MDFIWAVVQIGCFFIGMFWLLFFVIMGGHAAMSKKPLKENLNSKKLGQRKRNAIMLIIAMLLGEYLAYRIKAWWRD
jgi:hypothetical protein